MSANERRLMGPPETPNRLMEQSPGLFPSLQLSPDVYAHQFSGPATAPAYTDQRLFWDPSSVGFQEQSFHQQYQDPFQYSPSALRSSFASSSTVVPSFSPQASLPQEQVYDLPFMPPSMNYSYTNGPMYPACFTTSPRMPPPHAENPSMFLSSPARRFGTADQYAYRYQQHNLTSDRPAYAHQIEESRREQETKRQRMGDAIQPSITRSVKEALKRPLSPRKDSRPGLRRSATHTGVRGERSLKPPLQVVTPSRNPAASVDQSSQHRPGRSSPLKTVVDPISRSLSMSRNSNGTRGSLSLAIDEDGVAKMVLTDQPQGGNPGSEAGNVDNMDLRALHTQVNSFGFPDNGDPSQQAYGLQRSYSHSKTSSRSTNASVNSVMQQSNNPSTYNLQNIKGVEGPQGARRKRPLFGLGVESDSGTENDLLGNAQLALRAIIEDRDRSGFTQGDNSNLGYLQSSPPMQQTQYAMYNASPTTLTDPDLATPSTDRDSLASNQSMRCVCNSSVLDGSVPLIQCDSCCKWLHSSCVGIDARRILDSYMCVYCVQTPKRPVHPSLRPSALPTTASPLAHKSKRHR
ncbi:hypothetical protein ABEF95_007444 [Exophiala dermatitidis]